MSPEPEIVVEGKNLCFTGTFSYGNRKDCQAAVVQRGGLATSINFKLNYLVIGSYATDSWVQSSWGRKIEKAIHLSQKGANILIVSEAHWSKILQLL